jgi:S-layer protein
MTDFTSLITGWFEAAQFRAQPAADRATFNAGLNNGTLTGQQVQTAIINDPFTVNTVDAVIREYQAAFGRVPDQAGLNFWVNQVAANPSALSTLSTTFANSPEFESLYGATASTSGMGNVALVTSLFTNVLGRAPDAAGLAFWTSQPLNAAQLLQAFAQSPEFITDTTSAITNFEQDEINGTEPTAGSLFQPGLGNPIVQGVALTTGNDNVTAQDITGTLTSFLTDGKGPTFNSGDVIKGSEPAPVGDTLTIPDTAATPFHRFGRDGSGHFCNWRRGRKCHNQYGRCLRGQAGLRS